MYIQVMTEEQAQKMPHNPFDLTKVWYKKDFPLIEVGLLELNRNPDNYFQDVEQAAFNPAAVVPGISFSPDKMLQGRLFSYGDAHRYRLGVNHHQIPVNSPKHAQANPSHRDGQMRLDGNSGATPGYEPNSFGEWQEQPAYKDPPLELSGVADNWNFREDDSDYYTQPGKLFRLMSKAQQQVLFENTARAMGDAPEFIKIRHIANRLKADPAYGKGVANALGIPLKKVK
jgi:catalase